MRSRRSETPMFNRLQSPSRTKTTYSHASCSSLGGATKRWTVSSVDRICGRDPRSFRTIQARCEWTPHAQRPLAPPPPTQSPCISPPHAHASSARASRTQPAAPSGGRPPPMAAPSGGRPPPMAANGRPPHDARTRPGRRPTKSPTRPPSCSFSCVPTLSRCSRSANDATSLA